MKRTTMILAGLMTFGSASAFAEGGAERMRYYYESLRLSQRGESGNVTQDQLKSRVPDDQTAQVTESLQTVTAHL